jgi:hypothetical protein
MEKSQTSVSMQLVIQALPFKKSQKIGAAAHCNMLAVIDGSTRFVILK